jgi:hypothetical protein
VSAARKSAATICALLTLVSFASVMRAQDHPDLALPTDNDALFHGGGAEFYQHIERDYKGAKSMPWEGGQYGFVRNPVETSAGVIYTRFHEGIDIRPLNHDDGGDPVDQVRAIADGIVVYTNRFRVGRTTGTTWWWSIAGTDRRITVCTGTSRRSARAPASGSRAAIALA